MKVVPLPGSESTLIIPRCSETILWQMASPSPVPFGLVVKNGVKSCSSLLLVHPRAVVADFDCDHTGAPLPLLGHAVVGYDPAGNLNRPDFAHRFHRVLDQVQKKLGQKRFICQYRRDTGVELLPKSELSCSHRPFLQDQDVTQDLVQVDLAEVQFSGRGQFQKFLDDPVHPAHFLEHYPGIVAQFALFGKFLLQELRGALDPAERVLDFMGKSCRQCAEGGEPGRPGAPPAPGP